ncbi:MAG: flagellar basal body rod protein FlgB [Syntrophaceae bacterium]|nr:flagellar basal body rod protein FlgB [Syntrophaceae bacterium]
MEFLFGKTIKILTSMMDFRSQKHQLITSNIANIDTPEYTSKDLQFKGVIGEAMRKQLTTTSKKHLSGQFVNAGIIDSDFVDSEERVNVEKEMANLAENHLMYNLSVELLSRKFRSIKSVLNEVK